MAFLCFLYLAFVVFTPPSSFGLTIQPDGHSIWVVTRLLTFSLWMALAALLLNARRSPISWRSFAYAFLGSSVLAIAIAPTLVPSAANDASVVGTIGIYASAAGFVCITVTRPLRALVFGALLFSIQLLVDATGHLLSGQFRLH
jgi:hypothetical protein